MVTPKIPMMTFPSVSVSPDRVVETFILVVAVAVVMWKSAASISKVCFPPFLRLVQASVEYGQLASLLSGAESRVFLASSIR